MPLELSSVSGSKVRICAANRVWPVGNSTLTLMGCRGISADIPCSRGRELALDWLSIEYPKIKHDQPLWAQASLLMNRTFPWFVTARKLLMVTWCQLRTIPIADCAAMK